MDSSERDGRTHAPRIAFGNTKSAPPKTGSARARVLLFLLSAIILTLLLFDYNS